MSTAKSSPPSPSGRRRPAMSRGDRQEIALLDSAERLLAEKPLSEVTIADIAAGAGLSRAAVYFYFDGKDAVVEAAIARSVLSIVDTLADRAALPGETAVESVEHILRFSFDLWRRNAPLVSAANQLLTHRPSMRMAWEDYFERCARLYATAIERDRARGVLPDTGAEPYSVAMALSWMAERSVYMLFTRAHTPQEEDELLDTLMHVIRRTIGAEEPRDAGVVEGSGS
ncbi:TetR/AcrR family transcriptional regulator [Marinactinospora rubrisoli]|uniref:TetR/AcrR family transcriptional regulator n=1 Tax=Marinactinospora rubrisoli TaxID=2715399 RepID=A0ABW2KGK3_9ACTN